MRGPTRSTGARAAGPILSASLSFVIVLGIGLAANSGEPAPIVATDPPTSSGQPNKTSQPSTTSQPEDAGKSTVTKKPNTPAKDRPEDGTPTKAGTDAPKSDPDECRPTPLCTARS